MKKQFGLVSIVGSIVLLVSMMASSVVTGATDATVSLDKSWYTNETALAGDTVKITVTDAHGINACLVANDALS